MLDKSPYSIYIRHFVKKPELPENTFHYWYEITRMTPGIPRILFEKLKNLLNWSRCNIQLRLLKNVFISFFHFSNKSSFFKENYLIILPGGDQHKCLNSSNQQKKCVIVLSKSYKSRPLTFYKWCTHVLGQHDLRKQQQFELFQLKQLKQLVLHWKDSFFLYLETFGWFLS